MIVEVLFSSLQKSRLVATYKCAGENAYNLVELSNVVILDLHLDQQIRVKVLERVIFHACERG